MNEKERSLRKQLRDAEDRLELVAEKEASLRNLLEDLETKAKTGQEIHEYIASCWDRHCSRILIMKPEEVPEYEKDLKESNEKKWVLLDDVKELLGEEK